MSNTKSYFFLILARAASLLSKRKAAASLVLKSINLNSEPQPADYRRAANFLRLNKQNTLAKEYDLLTINCEAKTAVDIKEQAKANFSLGRTNEALAAYQRLAREYSCPYEAYYAIALFYRKTSLNPNGGGRWRDVVGSLEAAITANPDSARAWSLLGEAYLVLDETDKALNALERANAMFPSNTARFLTNNILLVTIKVQGFLSKNSKLNTLFDRLKRSLIVLGFGPRAVATWYDLGRCYECMGNKERSNHFYEKAIAHSFDEKAKQLGTGVLHAKRKRWQEALRAYSVSFQENPKQYSLALEMGHIQRRLGIFNKAHESYQLALKAGADQGRSLYYIGSVYEAEGKFNNAIDSYQQIVDSCPTEWPRVFYRLGFAYSKVEKYLEANNAFFLMDINKESISLLSQYIFKNSEEKLEDRTVAAYWWQLGLQSYNQENWPQAASYFQHALYRESNHFPCGQYLLGVALYKLGEQKQASEAFLAMFIDRDIFNVPQGSVFKHRSPSIAISYVHYRNNLKVQKNVVVYESYSGATIRCNPRAIFDQRALYDLNNDWIHVWVLNDNKNIPEDWKALENVVFVRRDSQRYVQFLASAAYFINNSSSVTYLARRPEQKFLNTWHGTPLKTLGRDIKTEFNGLGGVQRNFLQTTHLISPNEHTTKVMLDSYDLRNVYTGKLAETGYPRIDYTINASAEEKAKLKQELGLESNKPVILFAPTWRGTLGDMDLDFQQLEDDLLAIVNDNAQLVFRGHYFLEERLDSHNVNCAVAPSHIDTNKLLSIVDVLITDYSSICVDFIPKKKPIIYYAYDQEKYAEERGLYIFPEDMPGELCRTREELAGEVSKAVNKVISTNRKDVVEDYDLELYNHKDDGNATKRAISFFFHEDDRCKVYPLSNEADIYNVLIYPGSMATNGITSALLSLIHNLDRNKVNPVIANWPGAVSKNINSESFTYRFEDDVQHIPRVGSVVLTSKESQCLEDAQRNHFIQLTSFQKGIINEIYSREYLRFFGCAKFDALVDFTGYDQYWSRLFAFTQGDFRRVIYLHNDMLAEYNNKFNNLRSIFSLYERYDSLVSVSEQSRVLNQTNLSERFGIDSSRFVSAENVFDVDTVKQRAKETIAENDTKYFNKKGPLFITMGRLSAEKDQAKLIRAFSDVIMKNPTAKLLILGDGPLRSELDALISSLNLHDSIHMLGLRSNPLPLMAKADCFVLSSNHEGKPVVIFEAMAVNTPVISTDLPGIDELLSAGGGGVVENSQEALAQAMSDFASGKLVYAAAPDMSGYRESALNMFYEHVLDLPKEEASKYSVSKSQLIAHRGGSGLYLENTLAAFEHAINSGCDGAELDVHLTADGAIVVHHNDSLNHHYTLNESGSWLTQADEKPFAELTLKEVREYRIGQPNPTTNYGAKFPQLTAVEGQLIPTLAEVVELVKAKSETFKLVIEIKSSDLFKKGNRAWQPLIDAVLAEVNRLDFAERTILCGFDWRALRYAKQQQPSIVTWMTTHPFDWLHGSGAPSDLPVSVNYKKAMRKAFAEGGDWFDGFRPLSAECAAEAVHAAGGDLWFSYYADCSRTAIAKARELNLEVGAWTVNLQDPRKLRALQQKQINALCLDYF